MRRRTRLLDLILASLLPLALGWPAAADAADSPSFKGQAVTMIIGSAPGGGTDASGRIIATFLARYLPGKPSLIVRNVPGAEGITAMNYVAQQAKPDGLTIVMGSASVADPMNYRQPNAQYDPAKFRLIGGVGRGGSVLIIDKQAAARLADKSAAPVIMGSNEALPRNGMQMTVWGIAFLGWNAHWVSGYPGTNEVMLALDRGEVDMTATSNMFQLQKMLESGKNRPFYQTGSFVAGKMTARADLGDLPLFSDAMAGKISDPLAAQAFKYWESLCSMDKWVALPPGTPDAVSAAYRAAFVQASSDPEFIAQGKRISDDFTPQSPADVDQLMTNLVETPTAATDYTKKLMRQQGLNVN
jgi:tripartite-type tricarboxylate transporter receptor subunit TctC